MKNNINIKKKNALKGEIIVPGDKSISHRAVMLGSIAEGKTIVKGFLASEDCLNTMNCFMQMGVSINRINETCLEIDGVGLTGLKHPGKELYVGNSGTSIRIISGILAGLDYIDEEIIITGDESICKRPMKRIIEPLKDMGAEINSIGGTDKLFPPLSIKGKKLKGIEYKMPVSSAQVKSCVLLAGLFADGNTVVIEPKPCRNHTEKMFSYFGVDLNIDNNMIKLISGNKLCGKKIIVPGDISSAAFFIVAALIVPGSDLIIKNVGMNSTRNGIIDVLKDMGGDITILKEYNYGNEIASDLRIKHSDLKGINIKGKKIPNIIDEIPIICLAGLMADGVTTISDAKELRVKESDRIANTVSLLKSVIENKEKIEEKPDGMIINGKCKIIGGEVCSHGDHRLAMMMSIAGLVSENGITVNNIGCVNTSFPGFFELLSGN